MILLKTLVLTALLIVSAACASSRPPATPSPPWRQPALTDVPGVYRTEWQRAANRESCALLAFDKVAGEDAAPRRANFSGGWAVAYDTPSVRSAFGIAGTGSLASAPAYDDWPYELRWSDGSVAQYGPEGGTGPNQLAYLRVAGEDCLYNVWSRQGRDHLESLLERIRRVR